MNESNCIHPQSSCSFHATSPWSPLLSDPSQQLDLCLLQWRLCSGACAPFGPLVAIILVSATSSYCWNIYYNTAAMILWSGKVWLSFASLLIQARQLHSWIICCHQIGLYCGHTYFQQEFLMNRQTFGWRQTETQICKIWVRINVHANENQTRLRHLWFGRIELLHNWTNSYSRCHHLSCI
jgi:hypothetical protein